MMIVIQSKIRKNQMFDKSADIYDAIYSFKDYEKEAKVLQEIIAANEHSPSRTILDVACGTGLHIELLRHRFQVEGLDLDPELVKIASKRNPGTVIHQGDMIDFDLKRQYDVVMCLFSAIGYVRTVERMNQAIAAMERHTKSGGILVIEPWLTEDTFEPGHLNARFIDKPELKIARMCMGQRQGDISILNFDYLVATPQGVRHFEEKHELGLFAHWQYEAAMRAVGLNVYFDKVGLMDRGLFVGVKE